MSELVPRLPTIFFGHGSPMETLGGRYADTWRALGVSLPTPKAVLMVSAHWYVDALAVTAMEKPRTIHDFYRFPDALYEIEYPAPGDPWLADRVTTLLAPPGVAEDRDWGLDHGTWSVLRHVFPDASVPVVQLSIDRRQPPAFHYDLGRRLRVLREEGVLVAGSGDIVHNLRAVDFRNDAPPHDWASRFNAFARAAIAEGRRETLVDYHALGEDARRSVPTPDHYLPLLYVLGAAHDDEPVAFFNDEIALASVSMLGFCIGDAQPGSTAAAMGQNVVPLI